MKIADYIMGSAATARRLQIESGKSGMPKLRDGYSRAQKLIDHIAGEGPIRTAELCSAFDLTSKQVWGMPELTTREGTDDQSTPTAA